MEYCYLDNASTTKLSDEVFDKMKPYIKDEYGNPSSIHSVGRRTRIVIQKARKQTAKAINAKPNEIYFTSGGSESDNLAIKGYAYANKERGNHIITSCIEHSAVINTCKFLQNNGFRVTYLPVDKYGFVDLNDLRNSITKDTILISIMAANNEIGTIEPIKEIGKIAHEHNIVFHTDAVQAVGNIKINVEQMNIDMLSMSAHKFHGPKGIGALYVRSGLKLQSLIHGGEQERLLRAGTENVSAIVGLGYAIEYAAKRSVSSQIYNRNYLISELLNIPDVFLNGPVHNRNINNVNIRIKGINGNALVYRMDALGFAISSGSACNSMSKEPSRVLTAIGLNNQEASECIRISISDYTTLKQINAFIFKLKKVIEHYRRK